MMEALNQVFTEAQTTEVADKILKATIDKIKDQLSDTFYNEMSSYLYQHYDNAKDRIEREIINQISDNYVSDPSSYKYTELRKKIWAENKDEIIGALTEDAFVSNLQNVLMSYSVSSYHFAWKWQEGIAKFILSNWGKFEENERMKRIFDGELNRLRNQVADLQTKNNELYYQLTHQEEA